MMKAVFGICIAGLPLLAGGCITTPSNPAATQPTTAVDPQQATPDYWMDQPAVASAHGSDYDQLWDAAERTARDFLFPIDRRNYRQGVLTTEPVGSRQFFEFWRKDTPTLYDLTRSSIQSLRRSVRFDFTRDGDGRWTVRPKVLVEEYASTGQRVTYVGAYTSITSPGSTVGSTESDEGIYIPAAYWFAIGRDHALEKELAAAIQRQLR